MTRIKKIFTGAPFIIGVFIIVYAGLGLVYYQRQGQYQDLQAQIARSSAIMKKPGSDLNALQDQLSKLEAQVIAQQASLPKSAQEIEITDSLVKVAQTSNVEVVSIQASPLVTTTLARQQSKTSVSASIGTLDNISGLPTLSFTLTVQGKQSDIMAFISNLAGSPELLESSGIKGLNISYNSSESLYAAGLELNIYVQPEANP